MSKTIEEWMQECYDVAESKGWHDKPLVIEKELMNFHAEISEAWEELRKGKGLEEFYYLDEDEVEFGHGDRRYVDSFEGISQKPEGFPIELADLAIRLFHTCKYHGIDLEAFMELKMAYNKTRSYRHGGKLA